MAQNYEKTMKQLDTGTPIRAHVVNDSNRESPDWSDVEVEFKMFEIDADTGALVEILTATADVELPTDSSGVLVYNWSEGGTENLGRFMALFTVEDNVSGVVETYPEEGYMWITVEQGNA